MATVPDAPRLPNLSSPRFGDPVPIEELPQRLHEVERVLREGFIVELMSEGRAVGELRAPLRHQELEIDPAMPDFMARMKEMWGDRTFGDSTKLIREDRDSGY